MGNQFGRKWQTPKTHSTSKICSCIEHVSTEHFFFATHFLSNAQRTSTKCRRTSGINRITARSRSSKAVHTTPTITPRWASSRQALPAKLPSLLIPIVGPIFYSHDSICRVEINFPPKIAQAFCSFCKNNQEPEDVYRGHSLKGSNGRVICHHLRAYTCPICKACGDNAHTMKYCPVREKRPTV